MKTIAVILLFNLAPWAAEGGSVSFTRQLAPILEAKCQACHSEDKAKGGYRAHTFAAALKAGRSDRPALVPGHPEKSELFQRLVADDPDDRMPQEDDPLPPEQIALFKLWIEQGALLDAGSPDTLLSALAPGQDHPAPPEVYPRPLPVLALAFSPDGALLAANGYREITLWTLEGALAGRLTNAPPRVRALAFHPAGGHLAAAGGLPGRAGELSIYNTKAGRFETNLLRMGDEVLAAAFSADGKYLAASGTDNAIHIFDWETRAKLATIRQHADWVSALDFSADGQRLASASRDRTARIYRTLDGTLETTYVAQGSPLSAAVFASPGIVASGGRGRSIHFWTTEDGRKQSEIAADGGIHRLIVFEGRLFSAGPDRMVRQHDVAKRELIRTYSGHREAVFALAIDSSGQRLASGSYDGEVRVWDAASGELQHAFYPAPGLKPEVR